MEAIIQSMTRKEREDPSILNASRRRRISAGSGQPVSKINQLVKRYDETKKMMKSFAGRGGGNWAGSSEVFKRFFASLYNISIKSIIFFRRK